MNCDKTGTEPALFIHCCTNNMIFMTYNNFMESTSYIEFPSPSYDTFTWIRNSIP